MTFTSSRVCGGRSASFPVTSTDPDYRTHGETMEKVVL
jgi:hypothetical protein